MSRESFFSSWFDKIRDTYIERVFELRDFRC